MKYEQQLDAHKDYHLLKLVYFHTFFTHKKFIIIIFLENNFFPLKDMPKDKRSIFQWPQAEANWKPVWL